MKTLKTRSSFNKLTLAATALAIFTSVSAFADFQIGRVRPGYKSDMTTVHAYGIYQGVQGALVTLNYEDGVPAPVSISVTLPSEKQPTTFPIQNVKKTSCGDHYEAYYLTQGRIQTSFKLTDLSNASCERVIRDLWEMSIDQSNGVQVSSELNLTGNPQALAVTM